METMKETWKKLSKRGKILSAALVVIACMIVYNWIF